MTQVVVFGCRVTFLVAMILGSLSSAQAPEPVEASIPGLILRKGNERVIIQPGDWLTVISEDPKTMLIYGQLVEYDVQGLHIYLPMGKSKLIPLNQISSIWDGRPIKVRRRGLIRASACLMAIGLVVGGIVGFLEFQGMVREDDELSTALYASLSPVILGKYALRGALIGGGSGLVWSLATSLETPAIEYPIGSEDWEIVPPG